MKGIAKVRVGSMEGTLSPSQSSARDSDEDVDDDDVYAEVDPLQEIEIWNLFTATEKSRVWLLLEKLFTVPWPLPKRQRRAKLRKRGRRRGERDKYRMELLAYRPVNRHPDI